MYGVQNQLNQQINIFINKKKKLFVLWASANFRGAVYVFTVKYFDLVD